MDHRDGVESGQEQRVDFSTKLTVRPILDAAMQCTGEVQASEVSRRNNTHVGPWHCLDGNMGGLESMHCTPAADARSAPLSVSLAKAGVCRARHVVYARRARVLDVESNQSVLRCFYAPLPAKRVCMYLLLAAAPAP